MKLHRRGYRAGRGRILLAAAAALVVAVSGCSSKSSDSDGPVTIDFLSYTYGQPNPGGEGLKKLISDFGAANPNITVNAQSVPVADALTKLQSDVVAGKAPDVAQIGWSKVAQAARTLPLRAYTDVVPAAEWKQTIDGIVPSVLAAAPVSKGEKIVAMPFLMATPVLYYNADLFQAAGLDPNRPPATFEEVKTAAQAIVGKGQADGVYVAAVDPGKSDYLTQSLVRGAGGALVTGTGEVAVDSPEVITALSTVQDLTKSGAQPAVDFASAQSAFNAGKLGMLVYTAAALPTLDQAAKGKFALQVAPFPGLGGRPAQPTFSGSGLSILAKDDAKAKAAWKFVQFLTNDKSFETITAQMGYLPLRPAAAPAADKRLTSAVQQLANLAPYTAFSGKQANQAVVVLQDEAVAPIVLRDADPAATLRAAANKIRGLG